MQWFKHDTDANQDAKLQNLLLDYGLEGYGLYWYCIELIAGDVDKSNITFSLEHDARIIARNTCSTTEKVEGMMQYFIKIGLLECSNNVITCLKLARRLDKSMTSNAQMREIIGKFKSHDGVMTNPDLVMQDLDLDQIRSEIKDSNVSSKPKRSKFKFTDEDLRFANEMFKRILLANPIAEEPNFDDWADTVRKMREINKWTLTDMWAVFSWANKDSFWCTNILSPKKLRKQFDTLKVKSDAVNQPRRAQQVTNGNAINEVNAALEKQRAEFYGGTGAMGGSDPVLHGQVDGQERTNTIIDLDNGNWVSD